MKNFYLKLKLVLLFVVVNITAFAQYTASILETGKLNSAIARDVSGNIYTTRFQAADKYEIVKYTNGTGTATVVYQNIVGNGSDLPYGLAIASNGDIYFSSEMASAALGKITRLNASSSYAATIVQTGRYFTGLTFDNQNRLYALEYTGSSYAVVRYSNPGTINSTGTALYSSISSGSGRSYPTSISVATNLTIYCNNVFDTNELDEEDNGKGGIIKLTTSDSGASYTRTDLNTTNFTSALYLDEFNNLYAIETVAPSTKYRLHKYTNGAGTPVQFHNADFASAYPYLAYGITAYNNIVYAIDGDDGVNTGSRLLKLAPTDVTPPSVSTGLTASPLGGSKVVLNWAANNAAEGISGYRIYGGTTANPTTLIGSVANGITTFTHTGLVNAQQYFYKISAVDLYFNEGPKTTDQSATTAKPLITSATYNATTKVLTVTGTNFLAFAGALNDIDVPKLKIRGEGGLERAISTSGKAEITDATTFSVTLAGSDQSAINSFINKNGSSSTGSTVYNLTATNGWAAGEDASINTEQTTIAITVSDVPVPTITYAEYNGQTGSLLVVGTNFYRLNGSNNDIVASKFTFTGEGGNTHTLQVTPNVEILGDKTFILALGSADKAAISQILNRNGTSAVDNTTFNLAAAEDWNAGAEASVNIADLTGNPVTVSNYVNVVLPIELVNFSHKKTNSNVVLNWSTSAEVNNKEFRLSRSIDGKDFTVIGTVNGTGNSSSLQNYSFTDKKPLIGQSYYKLTQVDLDNVIKLEKILPVSFYINSDEVVIYPNPATDVVSIKSNSSRYTKATLLDVSGKILGTYTLLTDVTDIDVAKLPKGVYLLNLSSNSENTVKKIVKN